MIAVDRKPTRVRAVSQRPRRTISGTEWLQRTFAVLIGVVLCLAGVAQAQPPGNQFGPPQFTRPTTSPYLNLLRRGGRFGSTALDYHRLVRPELQWRRSVEAQSREISRLQRDVSQLSRPAPETTSPAISTTGHSATFMNLGRYYPKVTR